MARKVRKANVEVAVERMNSRQFKKELIADVAESWVKHGKRILHLMAHEDPVRYAALIASLVPKQELPEEGDRKIVISWQSGPSDPPPHVAQVEPPRLLPPRPAEPNPGNLSDADWSLLSEMLSLARRALAGSDEPPSKVFSGMIAYLERYLDGK